MARKTGRIWAMIGGLALASGLCFGAQAKIVGRVVEWGRDTAERHPAASPEEAGTGLAPAQVFVNRRYIDHSDVIEARLCRSFGITVRITADGGDNVPDRVLARVIHPLFTRSDGATSTEDDFPSAVNDGRTGVGFTFDHVWELRPGRWSIVISADGVELASKTFEVVPPPLGASQSDCEDPLAS